MTKLLAAAALVGLAPHPQFVPARARVDAAWRLGPTQVLVEWHRVERVSPKPGLVDRYMVWRLVLWTKTGRWRPYYVIDGPTVLDPIEDVRLADVTHDGRRDVLASDVQGNHGSGPYRVVEGGPFPAT